MRKSPRDVFYEEVDLEPGEHYYTVLWDMGESHTPGINDEYIVLDKKTFLAKAVRDDYEVFEKSQSNGIAWRTIQYATVPEPSTIGLMTLTGLGLCLARRNRVLSSL